MPLRFHNHCHNAHAVASVCLREDVCKKHFIPLTQKLGPPSFMTFSLSNDIVEFSWESYNHEKLLFRLNLLAKQTKGGWELSVACRGSYAYADIEHLPYPLPESHAGAFKTIIHELSHELSHWAEEKDPSWRENLKKTETQRTQAFLAAHQWRGIYGSSFFTFRGSRVV